MSILDHFRNISGAEIYKETCEIIKNYNLRYQVDALIPSEDPKVIERRHKLKRKSFYLDGFADKDWFIQFKYCPVNGKFLPYDTRICKMTSIWITEDGIKCNPDRLSSFNYNKDYCLADWKKAKQALIKALEFALDTGNRVQAHWGDWLSGEEDKTLIHYEQAKKPNTAIVKKSKKPAKETDNA